MTSKKFKISNFLWEISEFCSISFPRISIVDVRSPTIWFEHLWWVVLLHVSKIVHNMSSLCKGNSFVDPRMVLILWPIFWTSCTTTQRCSDQTFQDLKPSNDIRRRVIDRNWDTSQRKFGIFIFLDVMAKEPK